jgi:hypothetical protein
MCPACIGSAVLYLTSGGSVGGLALLASRLRRSEHAVVLENIGGESKTPQKRSDHAIDRAHGIAMCSSQFDR